jgi:predicted ribosomally synthesized peptide with SipW-like signal peptide
MLRILKSLFVIVAVAAVATGATSAYFTDQEVVSGMTFTAGTLEIENSSDTWMTHVSLTNLKPGDTIRKWVKLTNTGSLDVASLKVSAVNKSDSTDLLDQMRVSVYGQVNGFDQGIYTPDWGNGQPVNSWLNNIDLLGTAVYRDATAAHVMVNGKTDTIILDFKVPASLGDSYQGATASFDLQFDAQQSTTGSAYF